ncbi:MAG: META domain-containing protein [Chloroflexota bacterium]
MSRLAPLPVALGALVLVGVMGSSALANDGPGASPLVDPNPNASAGAPTLEGTEWQLVKAQLSGAYADIPAEVEATLQMADGKAAGSGGCNQWFADYVLDGSSLTFGPVGSTLMLCEGPGGDVETFFLADLASVTGWAIDGTTLTLSGDTGPVLAFEPRVSSAPSLDGGWAIVAYNDGQGTLVAIDDGTAILDVTGGQLSGTAGCNRFMGTVTQDGGTIAVSQLGSTEMYCEGLMDREAAVLASLQASTQVQRADDGGLDLLDAAGTVQLHLVSPMVTVTTPSQSPYPAD